MNAHNQNPDTPSNKNPYNIHYDNYLDTPACTECTGLMYRAADGRQEWDAYREIFDFTPQEDIE